VVTDYLSNTLSTNLKGFRFGRDYGKFAGKDAPMEIVITDATDQKWTAAGDFVAVLSKITINTKIHQGLLAEIRFNTKTGSDDSGHIVIHIGFGLKTNATVVRTIDPVGTEYRPVEFKYNDDGDNSYLTIDFPDPDAKFTQMAAVIQWQLEDYLVDAKSPIKAQTGTRVYLFRHAQFHIGWMRDDEYGPESDGYFFLSKFDDINKQFSQGVWATNLGDQYSNGGGLFEIIKTGAVDD
jgi:hypothetical protein